MYKYCIIDGQYLLTRNFKLLTSREGLVTVGRILTVTIQSVVKMRRDFIEFEKPILVFDKFPYHRSKLVDGYKGSRVYYTESDLEGISDETEYNRIKYEVDLNNLKQNSKYRFIDQVGRLGIQCIIKEGYEADDLGYMIASLLKDDNKKSVVCSKDSDWLYFMNPNVDRCDFNGNITTYQEFYNKNIESYKDFNDLYEWKSYYDSMYGSHNDLVPTVNKGVSMSEAKKAHLEGNPSLFTNYELFKSQLKTFDIKSFSDYNEVNSSLSVINDKLKFATEDEFNQFIKDNEIRMRYAYYKDFTNNLNSELYAILQDKNN